MDPLNPAVRTVPSSALGDRDTEAIRSLLRRAFREGFSDEDWAHALGGLHAIAELDGRIVGHGSVVERWLIADGYPLRTGYVEGVATDPELEDRGIGSAVMQALGAHIARRFELGALSTGRRTFYERLGWRRWNGPTFVRMAHGDERTPEDDGGILYLRTPATPPLDDGAALVCEWRAGDVW